MEERQKDKRGENAELLIAEAEHRFAKRLEEICERITERKEVRLLRLVGPTCSGKTTAAQLLEHSFAERGKRLHTISIDDFYYDKDVLHARSDGAVDYDSVNTIDLPALKLFLDELFSAERSHCPIFDFQEGRRVGYRLMECGEDDLFLFEGIQVLYPELTALFNAEGHVSETIYIAPLSPVRAGSCVFEPNELRLLRRLVRDHKKRNTPVERTFSLWSGVRRNEEQNIFPYVEDCSYRIDSAMPYELGILAPYLRELLPSIDTESPYFAQAQSILRFMDGVEEISDRLLPADSLYREFV